LAFRWKEKERNRIVKIYTKQGDKGETSLGGGERVQKDHLRIEVYGTIDELNSAIGVVLSLSPHRIIEKILQEIQNELFVISAELATPLSSKSKLIPRIKEEQILKLESYIDELSASLKPLNEFIIPGGATIAANIHLCRTICRRAERLLVRLCREEQMGNLPLAYLNRLSDLLFVTARFSNLQLGIEEQKWKLSN
jgi:cob(I)alamin adenosyltransferase